MTTKILEPTGIIDGSTANDLRQEVRDSIQEGKTNILIDFSGISFINSSGLGALVAMLKTVRAAGGELYLSSLNDQVKLILELTRMESVFKILSSRQEFEDKFS